MHEMPIVLLAMSSSLVTFKLRLIRLVVMASLQA